MRVLIRTDANARIGTGHLMRCLALADGLALAGAEVTFACRGEGLGPMAEMVLAKGHRLIALPTPSETASDSDLAHAAWLPGGQARDAEVLIAALDGGELFDWLIVDHYALDHRFQNSLRAYVRRILVIDDLADRQHDCDLLLDQNYVEGLEHRYDLLVPEKTVLLLGPAFALLRPEFAEARRAPKPSSETVPRLLVMFGGADPDDLTLRVVNILLAMGWTGPVEVVAGPLYGNGEALAEACRRLPAAGLHRPAKNVGALMVRCDLAIGSPGVSSWERCASGLAAITIAQADNQRPLGEKLGSAGANLYLGPVADCDDEKIRAALALCLNDATLRAEMAMHSTAICDGLGVSRVVAHLQAFPEAAGA